MIIQYNTVKPNFKGPAVLLRFTDNFGFKKAKIKKRKIPDLTYLSANRFGFNVFGLTVLYCI